MTAITYWTDRVPENQASLSPKSGREKAMLTELYELRAALEAANAQLAALTQQAAQAEIEHMELYVVRVASRQRPGLKASAEALRGQLLILQAKWICEDDHQYAGEWAMGYADHSMIADDISWLASGDLEIIGKAPAEKATPEGWKSVDAGLPAPGEVVMVFVPPTKYVEHWDIRFDCIDPDDDEHASWSAHNECYEHFCCVAKPPGSVGPSEKAPYTHWHRLPAPPTK